MKETIRIFARLKPIVGKHSSCHYSKFSAADDPSQEHPEHNDVLRFSLPKQTTDSLIDNSCEIFNFHFDKVFEAETSQTVVFENVARPIIDRALEGYNGTLFAYGQSGSGKTFTISGVRTETRKLPGILPLTLSYVFSELQKNSSGDKNSVSISYFQIYNEAGYDLLQSQDQNGVINRTEDLPKIQLLEDAEQNVHLRNLTVHGVANEREALSLFQEGEEHRVMAETPMNQTSTRSHCIFTLIISRREINSAVIRTSKLHIIDLAGSERVYKSGIIGKTLTEAKCINLALHHLEQVITALADKTRCHIPYRNSMMTSILKDSLGGNCLTSMIATCSLEKDNLGETISTCRFAQRVAVIKNEVVRNEMLNPYVQIELLKKQIADLKMSHELANGENAQITEPLTDLEMSSCQDAVNRFLLMEDQETDLLLPDVDWRKVKHVFRLLRLSSVNRKLQGDDQNKRELNGKIEDLQRTLEQRDRELEILCRLLKQEKKRIDQLTLAQKQTESTIALGQGDALLASPKSVTFTPPPAFIPWIEKAYELSSEQLAQLRRKLLIIFIDNHAERREIEELKASLSGKVEEARSLGAKIRQSQADLHSYSDQLEQLRNSFWLQPSITIAEQHQEIFLVKNVAFLREQIDGMLSELRSLKSQVDHLERLLRQQASEMQTDFNVWWQRSVPNAETPVELSCTTVNNFIPCSKSVAMHTQ